MRVWLENTYSRPFLTVVDGEVKIVDHRTHALLAKRHWTRMWANAQRDGRFAEYRWRPVLNAAKFG